jgi:hypothetical protein
LIPWVMGVNELALEKLEKKSEGEYGHTVASTYSAHPGRSSQRIDTRD